MQELLVHPAYFGSIAQLAAMVQADQLVFENEDNYQKQSYRTRQYIYGANGKLMLNIPVQHSKTHNGHQKYREVQIENEFHWQLNHWRSLQTAYQTSPYFEFYEKDFEGLYQKKYKNLLAFNYDCLSVIESVLELDFGRQKTDSFQKNTAQETRDGRNLVNAKKKTLTHQERYPQVFEHKAGFLHNLSILDLIFNEGPNSLSYLQEGVEPIIRQ